MSITPFGLIIIVYTFFTIITKRNASLSYLTIWTAAFLTEGCITAGIFMQIGGTTFSVGDYFQAVLIIMSLSMCVKMQKANDVGLVIVFILITVLNILSLAFFPLNELVRGYDALDRSLQYYSVNDIYTYPTLGIQTYKTAIRYIIYIINALSFSSFITFEKWKKIEYAYIRTWKKILVYLVFEFITKNLLHWAGYISILDWFFGSGNTMMSVSNTTRNGLFVLIGFNNEPSHLLMIIIPFLLIYILSDFDDYNLQKKYSIIVVSLVICLLSGSFRAVGMMPIVLMFLVIKYRKNVLTYSLIGILLLGLFIFGSTGSFDYLANRINGVILDYSSNSYYVEGRLNTIVEAFDVFIKRPIIGCGLGTAFAYGFIPSILETFGLLGTMYWYRIMFYKIANIRAISHGYIYMILLSIMWIYTNAISTGYIGTTLLICCAISASNFQDTQTIGENVYD